MKYANVIVLVLVFLTAILLHWFVTTKENFQTTKTPLTKENVQATLDSFVQDIIALYQEYKKEYEKNKDPRIRSRVEMAILINQINELYPQFQYIIENIQWQNYTMVSLEELKLVTTFLTQRMGVYGKANPTSVDVNDIDTFSSRIKNMMAMIEQKTALIQGSSNFMGEVRKIGIQILDNIVKLNRNYSKINKADIPLLKSDQYWLALLAAFVNFSDSPVQDIPEVQLGNLPGGKGVIGVTTKITTVPTTLPPPPPPTTQGPLTASPTTPPATPPTPPPAVKQESMKFSELVKSLMAYGPVTTSSSDELLKAQYNTKGQSINSSNISGTPSSKKKEDHASIDDIKKVIRDEISQEFAALKIGPKDKVNDSLSSRSTDTIAPSACKTNSNALEQGSWFRTAAEEGCPYAQGQQATTNPVVPIDMSEYIRKDSIPCWGCKLK
jgi:hypothetical protein